MTINHDSRVSNPICDIWGVQPPITQVNRETQPQQLQSMIIEVDQKMIPERNNKITKINEKNLEHKDVTLSLKSKTGDQDQVVEVLEKQRVKSKKTKLFAGFGGGIGVTVGAVGFAVNPLIGVTAMIMGGGIGLGVGGIIGMTT